MFDRISLQTKFILVTSTSVIVLITLLGVMTARRESMIMHQDMERHGRVLADTLAIPIMNDLIYERLGLVEEGGLIDNYITEIFSKKEVDLLFLAVLDEKGRVIAHNDLNQYGLVYADPLTERAMNASTTVVQRFYDSASGYDALDVATPLSIGKKRWGTLKFAMSLRRVSHAVRSAVTRVILLTIPLIGGAVVIIYLLNRKFIKPVTGLARTMEQADGGLIDVSTEVSGKDEIGMLGQSFNRMIERIRDSNRKLKDTNDDLLQFIGMIERAGDNVLGLRVDLKGCREIALLCEAFNRMIDRIRISNIELGQTREKLLHSQKLASLGILAAGVAHEINNPLGGLFNCLQMMDTRGADEEFRNRYIRLMRVGLSRIEATVGRLLWMARKEERAPRSIEVRKAVEEAYGFVDYMVRKKNIIFRQQIQDGISLHIDPVDLQQIFFNLMINAIQSMEHGGTMTICATRDNATVLISVADTGSGIADEDVARIFDPFFTTKKPGEGTGLGLWLTYEIVKHYHGDISVVSRRGEGSQFVVTFGGEGEHEAQNPDH